MGRAPSASFLKVYLFPPFHSDSFTYPLPSGTNLLTTQPVAIKFVCYPYPDSIPFSPLSVNQEPRKSDAPQLRDEYRSYRTLNGTRMFRLLQSYLSLIVLGRLPFRSLPTGPQSAFPRYITSARRGYIMSLQSTSWVPISRTYSTCVVESLLSRQFACRRSKW